MIYHITLEILPTLIVSITFIEQNNFFKKGATVSIILKYAHVVETVTKKSWRVPSASDYTQSSYYHHNH